MANNSIGDLIRLGTIIIPFLVFIIAGQALSFNPNRRILQVSASYAAIQRFDVPWKRFYGVLFSIVTALLVLAILQILLSRAALAPYLPTWLFFQNPSVTIMNLILVMVVIWLIRHLKHISLEIFDFVFTTHLDFQGWRYVHHEEDRRPFIALRTWRYRMKWWFKTNLEPITSLQMRMIIEHPDFTAFQQSIEDGKYPESYHDILKYRPWGYFLGPIDKLMREDVLKKVFRAESLWHIWKNVPHRQTGKPITTPDEMAAILYDELRKTIVCPACEARLPQKTQCAACNGSGTIIPTCIYCGGNGRHPVEKHRCAHCGGLGLQHEPTPVVFLDRLQYLWMARNVDYLKGTFKIWLSNFSYGLIFIGTSLLFLGANAIFQPTFTIDIVTNTLLFSSAALISLLGSAIVIIFGTAFNSSGTILVSYPVRYARMGNHTWILLRNLLFQLVFGTLFVDTTFIMGQFLFEHHFNSLSVILAATTLSTFILIIMVNGVNRVHIAMRDSKRSQLDELEYWLYVNGQQSEPQVVTVEEDLYKEMRQLQEWPLDFGLVLGVLSGIILPLILSIGSVYLGRLVTTLQK